MAGPISVHKSNVLVGSGEIFIGAYSAAGVMPNGTVYVGDSTNFTLSVSETRHTTFSGDGPTAQKLIDRVIQKEFSASATLRDINSRNLAYMLSGTASTEDDAATPVTDEERQPKVGEWHQLGRSATKLMGYLAVSETGFAATGGADKASATTALVEGVDYELDAGRGRVYCKSVAKGVFWLIDYTPVAGTHDRAVVPATLADIVAVVEYVEDSADGNGRNVRLPRCTVGAQGDTAFKANRQGEIEINLTFGIQVATNGEPAVIIDGKAST